MDRTEPRTAFLERIPSSPVTMNTISNISRRTWLHRTAVRLRRLALHDLVRAAQSPLAARAPQMPAEGEARDLPLHVGRAVAAGSVRSEGLHQAHARQDHLRADQHQRTPRRHGQVPRARHAVAGASARPVGHDDLRSAAAHRVHRRRDLPAARDAFGQQPAPARRAAVSHRLHGGCASVDGFVDQLRPRHGESEPAELHHHPSRRRHAPLRLRLPPRRASGHEGRHSAERQASAHRLPRRPVRQSDGAATAARFRAAHEPAPAPARPGSMRAWKA